MVREDLKSAERDELIKREGYKAMDYHEWAGSYRVTPKKAQLALGNQALAWKTPVPQME